MSRPPIFDNFPTVPYIPWGPYRAYVAYCYDGDTPRFWVNMGLDEYAWKDIRLADVYAPEIRTTDSVEKAHGYEARDYLISLILGEQVSLRTEKVQGSAEVKTLDRYVGWVTRMRDGLDVNQEMVRWLEEKGFTGGIGT